MRESFVLAIHGRFGYNMSGKGDEIMNLKRKFERGILCFAAMLILLTGCTGTQNSAGPGSSEELPEGSYLRVDFVDVGQADFIVVECDGEYMTIDGGNGEDSRIVYSHLKNRGIEKVDTVVITHPHEDHYGGVATIFDIAEVERVYCPNIDCDTYAFRNLLDAIANEGLEVTKPILGEFFSIGSAMVQVIGPVKTEYDDVNDTSLVLRLTYGETSFLFTGDAEEISEKDILASGFDVSADVLKVGHHGSYSSTSYLWLKTVAPKYAVISSSRKDRPEYNHPHEVVVSRLRDADVSVYRTDLQGTVTCITFGDEIAFMVERNPDADTLYDAGEGGNH